MKITSMDKEVMFRVLGSCFGFWGRSVICRCSWNYHMPYRFPISFRKVHQAVKNVLTILSQIVTYTPQHDPREVLVLTELPPLSR